MFINPVQPWMPASILQHNWHLHAHISNAIRAWKEHLWKLEGINSKTRMHFTIVVVNLHKCSYKNICSHKWRSTFTRKHSWKFGFQHTATEHKTAEAGVRVSTSQRNKLVSLFNALNFCQWRDQGSIFEMYLLGYSQLIDKLVYSPKGWTLLSAWQLFLASPCQQNMLLQLGNRCSLKLASVLTEVKVNWIRILWRVFGLYAWHCQNTLKFLICNNE